MTCAGDKVAKTVLNKYIYFLLKYFFDAYYNNFRKRLVLDRVHQWLQANIVIFFYTCILSPDEFVLKTFFYLY